MQMVLIDVYHLHSILHATARERITGNHSFLVVNRAFPMAVMQLRGADQGEKARRIDLVHELFGNDLDIVAMLFIKVRHATCDSRHGPKDFTFGRRIFADWRREAVADRRHNWCPSVIRMAILVAHSLGDPRLNRDWHPRLERRIDASDHAKTEQNGQQTGPQSAVPRGHLWDSFPNQPK